jgi:hypothetical protein
LVEMLTGDKDTRKTAKKFRTRAWKNRTRSAFFARQQRKWREKALGEVQRQLNRVPFRNSTYLDRYRQYYQCVYANWTKQWAFAKLRKRRKLRYRAKYIANRELDRVVNWLCRPRKGDQKTVLIVGNAAKANIFGKIKKYEKGPILKILKRVLERKAAAIVWADEFRTSKLDIFGRKLAHPIERRRHRLPPRKCTLPKGHRRRKLRHPNCRCYCAHSGCENRCTIQSYCDRHAQSRTYCQYGLSYHNNGPQEHRMFDRDVIGAINIGCRFLAKSLDLDLGPWSRNVDAKDLESPSFTKSWEEIFGEHGVPFSFAKITKKKKKKKE